LEKEQCSYGLIDMKQPEEWTDRLDPEDPERLQQLMTASLFFNLKGIGKEQQLI